MRTEAVEIPLTARLVRERERWRHAPRPPRIETPGPGQRSVFDFPRPPAVERVLERITVVVGEEVVADTGAGLRVLETASPPTYYLPLADVRGDLLQPAGGGSTCEWKGRAAYFDLVVSGRVCPQAAWRYPEPHTEYAVLAQHIAFYASRVDRCSVGGEVVVPQPGDFYAGWITSELTGPFKGSSGTQGW